MPCTWPMEDHVTRHLTITGITMLLAATAANAQNGGASGGRAQNPRSGPLQPGPTRYIYDTPSSHRPEQIRFGKRAEKQMLLWGKAGRCVVASDLDASIAYAGNDPKSVAATAAAQRLGPAFDVCLAGSGIEAKSNKALRRAAIADALNARS